MDDRTYPDELARLRAEVKRLESELTLRLRQLMRANAEDRLWLMKTERLTHDLADAQTVANLQRDLHAAELDKHRRELTALRDERPRLLAANVRLFHDNNKLRRMSSLWKRTAKHYKRLRINDDRFRLLAESTFAKENEQLRAELDAERNAHNATAAQLYAELDALRAEFVSYQEHAKTFACKLKDELDVTRFKLDNERNKTEKLKVENDELRSLVDSIRSTYPELRPYDVAAIDAVLSGVPCAWDVYTERKSLIQANIALGNTAKQLRAELDAMREAHSVVAARMAAMGC